MKITKIKLETKKVDDYISSLDKKELKKYVNASKRTLKNISDKKEELTSLTKTITKDSKKLREKLSKFKKTKRNQNKIEEISNTIKTLNKEKNKIKELKTRLTEKQIKTVRNIHEFLSENEEILKTMRKKELKDIKLSLKI